MRYVWPITMWTSVAVTLLLCGLIVRSGRTFDKVGWADTKGFVTVRTNCYRFSLFWDIERTAPKSLGRSGLSYETGPADTDAPLPTVNYGLATESSSIDFGVGGSTIWTWSRLGLTSLQGSHDANSEFRIVGAPIAYFIAPFPLVALWALRQSRRRRARDRRERGQCPACGYDLRATPERCPECGAVVATNGAVEVKS